MKENEFNLGRKKYINLLKRKKKYLDKKQRLYDLLKEPLIKEYLETAIYLSEHKDSEVLKKQRFYDLLKEPLIKEYLETASFLIQHTDEEFDENLLSVKAFDKLAKKTEQPYGIYLYMGKCNRNDDYTVNGDYAKYILLVDIETLKRIKVSPSSYETLKQNNRIIFIENKNNERDFYEKKLLEMRKEYLSNLKDLDQESAKERIIKYGKNN